MQTPLRLLVAVNVAVNRLMADIQQASYLLGAVFQAQKLINVMPRLVLRDQGVAWAQSPGIGALLGELGLVALATAVPSDLAVNSACAVSNALRNGANGKVFS